jgi:hypothetical protein
MFVWRRSKHGAVEAVGVAVEVVGVGVEVAAVEVVVAVAVEVAAAGISPVVAQQVRARLAPIVRLTRAIILVVARPVAAA